MGSMVAIMSNYFNGSSVSSDITDVLNQHFPTIIGDLGLTGMTTIEAYHTLMPFCGYEENDIRRTTTEAWNNLINYMIDNKDKYEWWML